MSISGNLCIIWLHVYVNFKKNLHMNKGSLSASKDLEWICDDFFVLQDAEKLL